MPCVVQSLRNKVLTKSVRCVAREAQGPLRGRHHGIHGEDGRVLRLLVRDAELLQQRVQGRRRIRHRGPRQASESGDVKKELRQSRVIYTLYTV